MRFVKQISAMLVIISILISAVAVLSASAAITTFETQYSYETINKAWLTDLTVKESMNTISDVAASLTLVPHPDYPYTETAESFAQDVNNACKLYELDENSARSAYIYLFEVLNDNSSVIEDETSDEDIKKYLVERGIVYPDNSDPDTLVMARALYTIMITGELDSYLAQGKLPAGTALEAAVVSYLSVITGVDMSAVKEWTVMDDNLSLDEYILAFSKYSLWCNGYDVSVDMDASEVYRLIALMTLRKQGVAAPQNLSFEELKIRYLAAMLGEKYEVTCQADDLALAMQNGMVPYYILQLMGEEENLVLRPEVLSYENAFLKVAEETGRFDLSLDEFYADVSDYSTTLKFKRNSIWVYPVSYVCYNKNNQGNMVTITANGQVLSDGNFNEIKLDTSKNEQLIVIRVAYEYNFEKFDFTYNLTVKQGLVPENSVAVEKPELEDLLNGNYQPDDSLFADDYISNDSDFVSNILASAGLGVGFDELLNSFRSSGISDSSVVGSIPDYQLGTNGNNSLSSLLGGTTLSVLPSTGNTGLNSSLNLPDNSISMSVSSLELFGNVGHTARSNEVLSGIGGLELYSVANTVSSALGAVVDSAAPVISTYINDLIFSDGNSVVGASVSDGQSVPGASNLSYVSALTDTAVATYSNGDASIAASVDVDAYLSHAQAESAQPQNELVIEQTDTQMNPNKFAYIAVAFGVLSVAAGAVLLIVAKQRKNTNY